MTEQVATPTTEQPQTAKKAPLPVRQVKMEDGREVTFTGKRRMQKETELGDGVVTTRFDFANGSTRTFVVKVGDPLALKFLGHGIEQKVGDETNGDETVDDMLLHVDAILERLTKGDWGRERATGDGFSGANIVTRALMEVTGKDLAFVKAFLEKKLEDGKEAGLTRQKLYAAFRTSGKTAPIIQRLEAEKAKKESAVDGDAAIDELMSE